MQHNTQHEHITHTHHALIQYNVIICTMTYKFLCARCATLCYAIPCRAMLCHVDLPPPALLQRAGGTVGWIFHSLTCSSSFFSFLNPVYFVHLRACSNVSDHSASVGTPPDNSKSPTCFLPKRAVAFAMTSGRPVEAADHLCALKYVRRASTQRASAGYKQVRSKLPVV